MTAPVKMTVTCPRCSGRKIIREFDARGGYNCKCPTCKGAGAVAPEKWLRCYSAERRATLTREDAIHFACSYLGLERDGSQDPTRYGAQIGENGVGGFLVDCEEHGHMDVAARFVAKYPEMRGCDPEAKTLLAFVEQVRAVRRMTA